MAFSTRQLALPTGVTGVTGNTDVAGVTDVADVTGVTFSIAEMKLMIALAAESVCRFFFFLVSWFPICFSFFPV